MHRRFLMINTAEPSSSEFIYRKMLITQIETIAKEYREQGAFGELGFIVHPELLAGFADQRFEPKNLSEFRIDKHKLKGRFFQIKIGKTESLVYASDKAFYDRIPLDQITVPVRVLKQLGVETLILIGKAKAISPKAIKSQVLLVKDHINFMGTNPLIGPNLEDFGPRFPDMTNAYNSPFTNSFRDAIEQTDIAYTEGVLMGITGPYNFSDAERQMAQTMGADALSHRDVAEVIVAKHAGMEVLSLQILQGDTTEAVADTTETKLMRALAAVV